MSEFLRGVKQACTGSTATPFVLIGNFEVEDEWAEDEVGLPIFGGRAATAIVNRMDEFALLLAGPGDHVVLKAAPDPDYLAYLESLGIGLPGILLTDVHDPGATVSADALRSPRLLAVLRSLADRGAHLLPHGMSAMEQQLCDRTGLAPALPPVPVVKAVNSKIYSRRLATELGLPQAAGWEVETVAEFAAAAGEAARSIAAGRRVGVKDAYGVSGKGIMVFDDARRLHQLVRMVTRRADRSGDPRIALVLEEWADKALDLNYHFTVGRDGTVRFDFVKEALTENGVHKGHRIPARISPEHVEQLVGTAGRIGARLAADGFHGVVGVDAITTGSGGLLPVLEINARNNMSTYQTALQERFLGPDTVAVARQYDLRLRTPLGWPALRDRLGDLVVTSERRTGLLVNNFATVNAAAPEPGDTRPYAGRLYGLLIARTEEELTDLDRGVTAAVLKETAHV
ncbi:ATP-grasp domain-containing protein [Actinoplanes sp. G11-F43]|uniref:preATP grasp domain-containing protein n=1 Tax=Actinoplanes sp. G11-F43 TaxID=3424130 RepID=UPI003D33267F